MEGLYCGTVSYDTSFRFWDVETGQQLLLQDGHAREVMGIDFLWCVCESLQTGCTEDGGRQNRTGCAEM